MTYPRAFIFWTLGTINTIWCALTIIATTSILQAFGVKDTAYYAHKIATIWGSNFFRFVPGWKVTVYGKENLPADRVPVVYIANHQSMTDIFAMYCVGVQFRWLSKAEVFKVPLVGNAMLKAGYIPVLRGHRDSQTKAMEASAERLKANTPMFFFPEGTRSETGELRPFKSGAFRLASQANVPIVPVCMSGTGDLMIKGSKMPAAAHIRIRILPALVNAPGEDHQAYAERAREAVIAGIEQLKKDGAEQLRYSAPLIRGSSSPLKD